MSDLPDMPVSAEPIPTQEDEAAANATPEPVLETVPPEAETIPADIVAPPTAVEDMPAKAEDAGADPAAEAVPDPEPTPVLPADVPQFAQLTSAEREYAVRVAQRTLATGADVDAAVGAGYEAALEWRHRGGHMPNSRGAMNRFHAWCAAQDVEEWEANPFQFYVQSCAELGEAMLTVETQFNDESPYLAIITQLDDQGELIPVWRGVLPKASNRREDHPWNWSAIH